MDTSADLLICLVLCRIGGTVYCVAELFSNCVGGSQRLKEGENPEVRGWVGH